MKKMYKRMEIFMKELKDIKIKKFTCEIFNET